LWGIHATRPRWAALHFAGVGFGIALSALLINVLQGAGADWRTLWVAAGAASTVAVPLAAWLVPGTGEPAIAGTATRGASSSRVGLPRGLGALTLCHGLFGFGYVVTATFIVVAVRASPTLRTLEGEVWLVVGLAAMPSTALWAWVGQRAGVLLAYALACLLAAVGVAAGGLLQTPAGMLLAAALLGGTFMGITALGFTAARALAPEQGRRSSALITAGFGVGQIAGPLVAGRLLDATGSFAVPSTIAAVALAVTAVVAGVAAQRPKPAGAVTRSEREPRS